MRGWIAAAAASGMLLAGCGSGDGSGDDGPAAAAPPAAAAKPGAKYTPASDVSSNAAIGKDVAAIRALLDPEAGDVKPDFAAAQRIWTAGKFSKKSDGTNRTLAEWVEKHPAGTGVADALAGDGTAAGLSQEARAQWVDKGMIVALKSHALEEFDGAKEKLAAGELDPKEGAIHNVDEVWAYFDAEGEGVGATAAKRAKDFGLGEHSLTDGVVAGVTAAQSAVRAKDEAGVDTAAQRTRGAINKIFALAVKKYAVEGAKDATARAEGLAFSWALHDELAAVDLKTIQGAFAEDAGPAAAKTVSDTLDEAAAKLGFDGPLPVYTAG